MTHAAENDAPDPAMQAFIAGWLSHARNGQRMLPEDAWHAYRLIQSARVIPPAMPATSSDGDNR